MREDDIQSGSQLTYSTHGMLESLRPLPISGERGKIGAFVHPGECINYATLLLAKQGLPNLAG